MNGKVRTGAIAVAVGAVALAVLHQDFWWWDSDVAVGGMMPIGLGFHVLYSFMAAGLWALACKIAWPEVLEEDPEELARQAASESPTGEASS